jgi:hypothetical protein
VITPTGSSTLPPLGSWNGVDAAQSTLLAGVRCSVPAAEFGLAETRSAPPPVIVLDAWSAWFSRASDGPLIFVGSDCPAELCCTTCASS